MTRELGRSESSSSSSPCSLALCSWPRVSAKRTASCRRPLPPTIGPRRPPRRRAGGAGASDEETTTTTAAVANAPANVTVLVANGSGKSGVAATNATKLKTAGYTKVDTTNSPTTSKSAVYYASGAQADAQAVADRVGPRPVRGRGRAVATTGRSRRCHRVGGHRLRQGLTLPRPRRVVSCASEHSHAPDGGVRALARCARVGRHLH